MLVLGGGQGMHVVKIRDDQGIERIYAAKLLRRDKNVFTFCFKGSELNIAADDVLEIVSVFENPANRLH